MNGKGSKPRSCFSKSFKNNYDEINWNKEKFKVDYGDGAVYITCSDKPLKRTISLPTVPMVIIDLDKNGVVKGIEILGIKKEENED